MGHYKFFEYKNTHHLKYLFFEYQNTHHLKYLLCVSIKESYLDLLGRCSSSFSNSISAEHLLMPSFLARAQYIAPQAIDNNAALDAAGLK